MINDHKFYNEYILPVLEEIKEEFKKRGVETNINDRTLTVKGIEAEAIILSYEYHMAKFWVDNDYHHLFSNIFDGRRTTELIFAPIKPKSIYDLTIGDEFYYKGKFSETNKFTISDEDDLFKYKRHVRLGRAFLTEEELDLQTSKEMAVARIKKRAHELQGDWKPDWENHDVLKYLVLYNNYTRELVINGRSYMQTDDVFFKTKDIALQVIKELPEECKLMLGVE